MLHNRADRIADIVLHIEAEMRRCGVWDEEAPAHDALRSPNPFCFDTLRFNQWMQWLFIPRMRDILQSGSPLPTSSDIHPYAEQCFRELGQDLQGLLCYIKEFDELITTKVCGEAASVTRH